MAHWSGTPAGTIATDLEPPDNRQKNEDNNQRSDDAKPMMFSLVQLWATSISMAHVTGKENRLSQPEGDKIVPVTSSGCLTLEFTPDLGIRSGTYCIT